MSIFRLKIGLCAGILCLAVFGLSNIRQQSSVGHHLSSVSSTEQQTNDKNQIPSESSSEKQTLPPARYSGIDIGDVQFYPASPEEQLYNQREILEQYKLKRKIQQD